jgi:ABC-type multidrug transport system fused ATPase/permease subunit
MTTSSKSHNFFRFLTYVAPYKYLIVLAAVGGIVKFTVPLLVPQLIRHLLDNVLLNPELTAQEQQRELVLYVGGLAGIFILFWTPWTYVRHYYSGKAGYRSVFDLRCDLYYRILRMSASFFGRNKSGGIVSRLISDIELIQNLVGTALTNIWMDLAAVVVVLFFLLRIDPLLTLVALVTFPLYLYFFKRFQREIKASTHQVQSEIATLSGNVQEKISGNTVVRAFNQEKREEENFFRDSEQLLSTSLRRTHYQSANLSVTGILTHLAPLIVILYGGYVVIHGRLTVGELVAVSMYLSPLYLPLQRFSELNVVFANSMAALDRVFEILDAEPEIKDRPNAVELVKIEGSVEFDRVYFSYNPHDDPSVLQNVTFTVEPGQKVALVGPSGSGKSTVVSLIPRFYDVQSGAVRIDGRDVRDVKLRSLRNHIGMVLQTPILFSGTVRENILYGKPKASNNEVIAACKAANAYDFIRAMPKGFDTEVGEGGALLSGGQRQRITIARAFLKNPRILILDEATSALDAESERLIQAALERLMIGRTTFIIAHRLSTIINADRIFVLEHGRLIDSGTHRELVARKGVYQDLYQHVAL